MLVRLVLLVYGTCSADFFFLYCNAYILALVVQ